MKHILFILMFLQLCYSSRAEVSEVRLAKSRDYLANWISIEVLKELSRTNHDLESNYRGMRAAVPELTIENALGEVVFGPAAEKEAPRLYRNLTKHIFHINILDFKDLEIDQAAEALVDSALEKINILYSSEFAAVKENRDRLVEDIIEYLGDKQQAQSEETRQGDTSTGKSHSRMLISSFNPDYINVLIILLFLLTGFLYYKVFFKKAKQVQGGKGERESVVSVRLDKDFIKKIVSEEIAREFRNRNIKSSSEESQSGLNPDVPGLPLQNTATMVHSTREKPVEESVFYMTFPINDHFPLNAKSNSPEGVFYRFQVQPGNQEASFEWHNSGASSIHQALSAVARFIEPACNEENNPLTNTRSIRTLKPGKAVLEGDKWIIKEKALIRYE